MLIKDNKEIRDTSKIKNKDIFVPLKTLHVVYLILVSAILGAINLIINNMWELSVQTFLLCGALIYMAIVDYKLKLVSDYFIMFVYAISLFTIIPSIINGNWYYPLFCLIAAIVVPLPLFIAAFISNGGIGGGDIKLISAISLTLGMSKGVTILLSGMILAIIVEVVKIKINKQKIKEVKTSFAMVPYFSIVAIIVSLF